ncbi:hypothetical protein OAY17_03025 [Acidimicrobiia bacterium]|nr:hypothetical protein [Acidimicrobiia bacterium]MDB4855499.1 hypothetical protein [Acidimicrobiia bacterium]MDC3392558.1 hypothetical protein [Acidimicrobiia bacterium]
MKNILNKNKFKKFPIISLLIVAMCGGSSTTVETSEAPPVEIDTEVEVDNDFNEENQNEANQNEENQNEENQNEEFVVLEFDLDYEINKIFSCLDSKGVGGLPYPEINTSEIVVRFDDGYDEAFFDLFYALIPECEEELEKDKIYAQDEGNQDEGNQDEGNQDEGNQGSNSNRDTSNDTVVQFEIVDTYPHAACLNTHLDVFINVFGIYVVSTSSIPEVYQQHTANVLAQYIDNDADGVPDDEKIIANLRDRLAVFPVWTPELREKVFSEPCDVHTAASMYRGNSDDDSDAWALNGGITSTNNINTRSGVNWDTNLEEVWHLISSAYYQVYPEYFADGRDCESCTGEYSKLTDALDAARGGRFFEAPSKYPEGAWYTYDIPYVGQAHEYMYWILMANFNALDPSITTYCENIYAEWRGGCNKEELKQKDVLAYDLLNNYGFKIPTVIPDGNYKGNS